MPSGDVPPGALFYRLRRKLFNDASLEKMLYERSGLLGLCDISADMRVLQESADPRAIAAVQSFVYAMTKYVGAYVAVLGGLDAFVFTAGIGENSAPVRAALCLWDDSTFELKHWHDFSHIAVVTDHAWLRAMISMFKPFFHGEVRLFTRAELPAAKDWITDTSERT